MPTTPERPPDPRPARQPTPSTPTTPTTPTTAHLAHNDANSRRGRSRRWEGRQGNGGGRQCPWPSPGRAAISTAPFPRPCSGLRYDAGFDLNRPDRATYFYRDLGRKKRNSTRTACKTAASSSTRRPAGPNELPARVDYQEGVRLHGSYAASCRFSGFLEVPYRYINLRKPAGRQTRNPRTRTQGEQGGPRDETSCLQGDLTSSPNPGPRGPEAGDWPHCFPMAFSDIQFGFKYALVADPDQLTWTFQLRGYRPPPAAPARAWGTGHLERRAQACCTTSA